MCAADRGATRRGLLVGALATALGGCARLTDPVVHGTNPTTPLPIPSPDPVLVAVAGQVAGLRAGLAALTDAPRGWRDASEAMLSAHLGTLTARDPLSGQPSPRPWTTPSPSTPAPSDAKDFATVAGRLAEGHAQRALEATEPDLALWWASMAVALQQNTVPGPAPRAGALPRSLVFSGEVESRNVLLAHLHALTQLLEILVGVTSGGTRKAPEARLGQVRALVTEEQVAVRAAGGDPVGPLPGYEFPGPVGTAAELGSTWALVEDQVLTARGPVLASAGTAGRSPALQAMLDQADAVRARGLGTRWFPGWA